jgi:bifunctional non-homologous end joining protein LigD
MRSPHATRSRPVEISHPDKVLYPASGTTKAMVLDYYERIAPVMLPHLRGRPASFKRFPDGVDGASFFQKHAPARRPEWIRTVVVPSQRAGHAPVEYVVVEDAATLLWAANLAALEIHVPLWRASARSPVPTAPDLTVFDLDPGPGTTIVDCCRVARWIAERLGEDRVVAKTSGSKGLQLYMRARRTTWERSSQRAHDLARALEADHGDLVVANMRKTRRQGRVLVDWSQNSPAKTTVAAYSLRGRDAPTVSTPVTWDEVGACERRGDPNALRFDATDVLKRVDRLGDVMGTLVPTSPARRAQRKG